MRTAIVASLVLSAVVIFFVRNDSAQRNVVRTIVKIRPHSGAVQAEPRNPLIKAEGGPKTTREEAEQEALEQARAEIAAYIYSRTGSYGWAPPRDYVNGLVRDRAYPKKDFGEDVGIMYFANLELELNARTRAELIRMEREDRSQDRMLWLGKLLALTVTLLAAVSGYVHLDEQTKGYYTNWLRLGVFAVVAAVGAGFFFLV
jgi:hypothetical protein